MEFPKPHEIYKRRFGRNVGLGLTLGAFVALVFGLTIVKMTHGDSMQAYDHVLRPEILPVQQEGASQ